MAEENTKIPAFKVEVDGREISDEAMAAVESIRFEEEINTVSMFVLKLSSFDFKEGKWRFIDLNDFHLGSETRLYMGMEGKDLITVGEIVAIEPHFGKELSSVEIRCYDKLHRLRFGKKQRTFTDLKDSDIASAIAGDWGLDSQAEDTEIVHPYLYQNNQNDLEFLLDRAKRIRYEVFVEGSVLHFRASKEDDSVSMTLEYRVELDEFSLILSTCYEGSEFLVKGWDFMKKELISATAKEGHEISNMAANETGTKMTESAFGSGSSTFSSAIVDELLENLSEAEKLAIARYNVQLVQSVTGEGKCAGIPSLRAGKTIEMKGIGRFEGIYYVTSTSHTIDSSGYNTSFKVRRVGV